MGKKFFPLVEPQFVGAHFQNRTKVSPTNQKPIEIEYQSIKKNGNNVNSESVTKMNLLGVKIRICWCDSIMTKHSSCVIIGDL